MTTTTKSSLRFEAPLIVGFFLVFIVLIPLLPREILATALILFFAYGVYSEPIPGKERKSEGQKKKETHRLFSETDFVVPACVPITLGWTYLQMATDGQTFTQRVVGIIGCIVAFGMVWFYVRKKFSNTLRVGISLTLSVCTSIALYHHSVQIAWAYDFQKGFNEMVKEHQMEANGE
ncbi:MAG: hypothetical protein KJT03_09935 [Verrucomicrobiae bacterium]|nr:hypothetical protein [Verrucomicrobiae bacterium]